MSYYCIKHNVLSSRYCKKCEREKCKKVEGVCHECGFEFNRPSGIGGIVQTSKLIRILMPYIAALVITKALLMYELSLRKLKR